MFGYLKISQDISGYLRISLWGELPDDLCPPLFPSTTNPSSIYLTYLHTRLFTNYHQLYRTTFPLFLSKQHCVHKDALSVVPHTQVTQGCTRRGAASMAQYTPVTQECTQRGAAHTEGEGMPAAWRSTHR